MRYPPRLSVPAGKRSNPAPALWLLLALLVPAASSQSPTTQSQPTPSRDAQKPATPADQSPEKPANQSAEVVTRDSATTFKVRVNLVQVRVVVRDSSGKIVDNLKKEDFLIYDNRKPQNITTFNVETPLTHVAPVSSLSDSGEPLPPAVLAKLPQRFVTLMFDDVNLQTGDAMNARGAAVKILNALTPSDRIAISTTSGQVKQDFTADHELLKQTLNQITPRPLNGSGIQTCPPITYYQADLIENKNDPQALSVAAQDALQCAFGGDPKQLPAATNMATTEAMRVISEGDAASQFSYRQLDEATRRLAAMPGQRKLVFISPGFILSTLIAERSDVVDRANRVGIVIDTLDARGLYTPDINGDITDPPTQSYQTAGYKATYRTESQFEQSEILMDFAAGTGGTYFHNRNDLDVALRESIAAPSTSYVLGFSPQNLKLNGSFHTLKVSLTGKQKYALQARHGYYAPRTLKDPAETAKEEIQEAVFSQEEIRDLGLDLQTQFFRKDATSARVSVLAHLDLKSVKFHKIAGRNQDDVTLATALFDQDGNFVIGGQKIIEMKLQDSTLDRLSRSGVTVKSSFDVKPGTYMVRLVVRDKEGEQMAARNGAVVIPY